MIYHLDQKAAVRIPRTTINQIEHFYKKNRKMNMRDIFEQSISYQKMSGVHKNNLVLHSQIGDLVEEFQYFFNDKDFNFKASDTFIRMVMISLSVEFLFRNTKVINYK
jgi:hypothetical protein